MSVKNKLNFDFLLTLKPKKMKSTKMKDNRNNQGHEHL